MASQPDTAVARLQGPEDIDVSYGKSHFQRGLARLRRDYLTLVALSVVLLLAALSYASPLINQHILKTTYYTENLQNTFRPPSVNTSSAQTSRGATI